MILDTEGKQNKTSILKLHQLFNIHSKDYDQSIIVLISLSPVSFIILTYVDFIFIYLLFPLLLFYVDQDLLFSYPWFPSLFYVD